MKRMMLASTCALALAALSSAASAQGWAGSADGNFGNIGGFPLWSADGAVAIPLGWNSFNLEGDIGASGFDSLHQYDGGGNLVWNGPNLRLAGTVIYNNFTTHGSSIGETQLGGGLEWYACPWLTVSGHAGGLVGKGSGGYVGGEIKGYVIPDLSLSGLADYTAISVGGSSLHETNYGARAEYLVSEEFPISIKAEYRHANLSLGGFGSGSTDLWTVGLKLNLNEAGAIPLVQHNRTGTLDTIGQSIQLHF